MTKLFPGKGLLRGQGVRGEEVRNEVEERSNLRLPRYGEGRFVESIENGNWLESRGQ